ncbi:hypothetical protein NU219Hw_g2209t1 [Hortaea werneckii]
MAPRDLTTHPVFNLERFLVARYRKAHELLETDVDAAKQESLGLLDEPPITEEYNEAMRYLIHARTFLRLFREKQNEVTPRILSMERDLDGIEEDIEKRKETGFQSGSDSTPSTSRAASPSEASGRLQESESGAPGQLQEGKASAWEQ